MKILTPFLFALIFSNPISNLFTETGCFSVYLCVNDRAAVRPNYGSKFLEPNYYD